MSGIILPGKDKNPTAGGGIELPKGFARKRGDEETATPAPAEATAEPQPTAQDPAEGKPARRGRGADFLFPPTSAQVQCPSCGTPYAIPIFSIIDFGANPELLGALLGGQINMAMCPACGVGGPINAPLMIHDPSHEFLGVFTPAMGMDDIQRQKVIGDLTQALMRRLPTEARRGYMFQPNQYLDWQRLTEKLWGFQGVTPEMLRRQRLQMETVQNLVRLVDDPQAFDIALERSRDLIDRQFFGLLDRLTVMVTSQGDQKTGEQMIALRRALLDKTEAGAEIKALQDKVAAIIKSIPPGSTREDVLAKLLDVWQGDDGREVASAIALSLAPMLDYQFLLAIASRLDQTTDAETRAKLEELRNLVMEVQEQTRQSQQGMMAQAQELLQAVLEAPDTAEALRENADLLDEAFLGLLASNIERAERNKATAAASRLREVYDLALDVVQERMPPELRLVNQLVNAPDQAAVRKLLEDNRSALNKEFIASLRQLEEDFRGRGSNDVADRLKSVRAQASLML